MTSLNVSVFAYGQTMFDSLGILESEVQPLVLVRAMSPHSGDLHVPLSFDASLTFLDELAELVTRHLVASR